MDTKNNNKTLRLFVAVPVPKKVALFLEGVQNALKKKGFKASWSRMDTMHLTLKFMGDTSAEKVDSIMAALEQTAAAHEPFELRARGVGVFPSVKKARVIWTGVRSENEILSDLFRVLDMNLEKAGIPRSRKRFSPHLTLARLKTRVDSRKILEVIQEFQEAESKKFECACLDLYQSVLGPSRAVHTRLFRATIGGQRI
ncbi:MAG: RNA 2',3'-cyclic phosphodiesterase [Desulfobacteraceae bacterium]|nr:RNA 2',3'-cyclic phosphodiesterase [Desulfobacteraceae bacterium]